MVLIGNMIRRKNTAGGATHARDASSRRRIKDNHEERGPSKSPGEDGIYQEYD
jgi:hypothetical protein